MRNNADTPSWFTDAGYKMFCDKYLYDAKTPREQYERIARTVARHLPNPEHWESKFFEMFWNGWYSLSTPSLSNTGTDRGLVVACSGNYIDDSISGFFDVRRENAILSKTGHGTSSYLGDIRPRGARINGGGSASGPITEFTANRLIAQEISQGGTRRGSWAGYLPIDHPDFWEMYHYVEKSSDDSNVGWCVSDEFIQRLTNGDDEASRRFSEAVYLRMLGNGYFFFTDKVNRARPEALVRAGLEVRASNLCTEIALPSNNEYTFSCVLGALNLIHWHDILVNDVIFTATVFLDALITEYLSLAKGVPGLEKIVHFTEDFRALGLGVMGLHSLYQQKGLAFSSYEAHRINNAIFRDIKRETKRASQWLVVRLGEPKMMHGLGLRNSHRTAMMPTMSTAVIMGGYSEGIGPMVSNVFTKASAGGEHFTVNPWFKELLESKGLYTPEMLKDVARHDGSFKHRPEFTDEEKAIGATAFEIPQEAILRQASARQKYICQAQSINLFFSQHEDEQVIADIHRDAFLNEGIQTLYYVRSSDKTPAQGKKECEACQ